MLFATSSFWQGVDVVGEALSCVIIDKLPFASPADPITAARIDAIRERGGEPFGEYQVPLAILALQQGLGRLIRHRQDRGVLAVLDPAPPDQGLRPAVSRLAAAGAGCARSCARSRPFLPLDYGIAKRVNCTAACFIHCSGGVSMVCRITGRQFRADCSRRARRAGSCAAGCRTEHRDRQGHRREGAAGRRREGHHRTDRAAVASSKSKTDKKGEFIQIGLIAGAYTVTVEKEGVGHGEG